MSSNQLSVSSENKSEMVSGNKKMVSANEEELNITNFFQKLRYYIRILFSEKK